MMMMMMMMMMIMMMMSGFVERVINSHQSSKHGMGVDPPPKLEGTPLHPLTLSPSLRSRPLDPARES